MLTYLGRGYRYVYGFIMMGMVWGLEWVLLRLPVTL